MTRQKTILVAWEVGANFGHAAELADVLSHLAGSARIVAAVRDVVTFRSIISDPRIDVLAAPHAPDRVSLAKGDRAISYADVMRFVGWHDAAALTAYLEAWEGLISLIKPDLIFSQGAPTALLAARALGIRSAVMGSGYDAPPRMQPMPAFHHWELPDPPLLAAREAGMLETVNTALQARGRAPLEAFREILDVEAYLLTTLPGLDHYRDRAKSEPTPPRYIGPNAASGFGEVLHWRDDAAYRILAYLRPDNPRLGAALGALRTMPGDTDIILAAPGASAALVEAARNTPVRLSTGPVAFDALFQGCDLGISHASHGLSARFALNGIPQIGMPNHTEQAMIAHALSDSNLGLGLIGKVKGEHVQQAIAVVRNSDRVARACADLSAHWKPQSGQVSAIAAREILAVL